MRVILNNKTHSERILNFKFSYFIVPVMLLLLSACAPVEKVKPEIIKPEIADKKFDEKVDEKVDEKKPELNVAILLNSQSKGFKNMASILSNKLNKNTKKYVLTGEKIKDAELIKNIQSSRHSHVVSLGLKATNAVVSLKSKLVVFSHVFNYKNHHLVNVKMKGVSVLPAPDQLFKDWKALSPGLSSVVLVTGDGLEDYVSYAKQAAARNGIELIHHVVKNDKEFVYIIKRLPLYTQGHWILPDSRILSRTAIKEVMSYNSKKGKQSVVFSQGLLSLGGLFYVNASDSEVASLIMKRLNDSLGEKTIPGEDVLRVRSHDMGINKKVANQLSLVIPEHYRKFIQD